MEETVLLHFEIDNDKAEKDLVAVTKAMISNKEAQQELTKAYKAGNITQEEFAKESIRLQANLKKEQEQHKTLTNVLNTESGSRNALRQQVSKLTKEYDNINQSTKTGSDRAKVLEKELFKLNAQLTEGNKKANLFKNEIGNYPKQFGDAAKGINIAGVSVGDLTTKFSSFLTPATAIAGIITGLAAAYTNSVVGAKDLGKATDILSSGFSIASNNYAKFIQEITNSAEPRGPLEKASEFITQILFGKGVANQASALADALEILRKLEIESKKAAGLAKDAEAEAEKARRIRDDDTKSYQERLEQIFKVESGITNSGKLRIDILKKQREAIIGASVDYKNELETQLKVADVDREIKDINEEITGKLTENVNARRAILKAQAEQIALEKSIKDIDRRSSNAGSGQLSVDSLADPNIITPDSEKTDQQLADQQRSQDLIEGNATFQLETEAYLQKGLTKIQKEESDRRAANHLKENEIKKQSDLAYADISADIAGSLSSLFDEQSNEFKILASAQALISTYSAAQKSYDSLAAVPYVGPALGAAAAAAAIVSGLARVANINGVQFAEGGWTGPGGKYDAVGVVHADEYVTPKHIVNSPAAQPYLNALESMRLGDYYDGGFVTNQNTAPANQAMITANALKSLPPPVLSVVEFNRVAKRVAVKENLSTF